VSAQQLTRGIVVAEGNGTPAQPPLLKSLMLYMICVMSVDPGLGRARPSGRAQAAPSYPDDGTPRYRATRPEMAGRIAARQAGELLAAGTLVIVDSQAAGSVRAPVVALNDGDIDGYLGYFHPSCLRWAGGLAQPVALSDIGDSLRELHAVFECLRLDEALLFGDERFACAHWRLRGGACTCRITWGPCRRGARSMSRPARCTKSAMAASSPLGSTGTGRSCSGRSRPRTEALHERRPGPRARAVPPRAGQRSRDQAKEARQMSRPARADDLTGLRQETRRAPAGGA
jgi:hypothetical protein